jgi:hypothetical protein
VPQSIKRTLTSMQIAQFIIGATFAGLHLFVGYSVPVLTPYTIIQKIAGGASVISSAASTIATSVASETASAGFGSYLKKLAFRAAGEEGLAENVPSGNGPTLGNQAVQIADQFVQETKYRAEYQHVNCIDTTGESFAIWLNLMYLFPLT